MNRRLNRLAFIAILFIFSMPFPGSATGATEQVGVKILTSPDQINDFNADLLIDYGSFHWAVVTRGDLSLWDKVNISYQVIENPYTLTLGGQCFDPLLQTPSLGRRWEETQGTGEPGLHLVQFHGPIKSAWREALVLAGLDVLQYIHPFTYVVWGDTLALGKAQTQPFVRWTGDYLSGYAVAPKNRNLDSNPILARIMLYPGAGLSATLESIQPLGGTILSTSNTADPVFDLVTLQIPGDQLQSIAQLPGVYTIQPIPSDGGDRGEVGNQVNAGNIAYNNLAYPGYLDWLSSLNLSGAGVLIANVDSGLDQTHPDLANRIAPCAGITCGKDIASNHGTHTAGVMAGDASSGTRDANGFLRGLGMAPGAQLVEQVYALVEAEPDQMSLLMKDSVRNDALISGNSWGPSGVPLGYDLDTRLVDIGVRDADPEMPGDQSLSYILSIMNGYGGVSTQGTPDEAKNTFTIGSTFLQTGTGSQSTKINDLSYNTAHGPALDGRNIPHLVAPGCYVDSTELNASFGLLCGTSMASPSMSGAAALFIQSYYRQFGENPSPALVKAAFLPVAHDLAGHLDADGGFLSHPFDSKQGWGRLNAGDVLDPVGEVFYYDQPVILGETGETWQNSISFTEPIGGLRAMLVWTDAPGHGLGGDTPAWVNNLDLSISIEGETFFGNNFGSNGYSISGGIPDEKNNTEGLFFTALPAGTYTLNITAANISGDGVPNFGDDTDQDFALVVYAFPQPTTYHYIFPLIFR